MAQGYFVAKLDDQASATDKKIVEWTRRHGTIYEYPQDTIVAIRCQVGGWVTFSNSLFYEKQPVPPEDQIPSFVNLLWDPPGEDKVQPGPSQHTYFDDVPLSRRDEGYQETAINWFVDVVLASYLRARVYLVEPTEAVVRALDGRLPETAEDIAKLACSDAALLDNVHVHESTFSASQISPALRRVCRQLLEDLETVTGFIQEPEAYLEKFDQGEERLIPLEVNALVRAAREKPEAVLRGFDSVELGRAAGDQNIYLLVGVNRQKHRPDAAGWAWLTRELPAFIERHGFFPAFGCFVTQAQMHYHVVLGPGVTEREKRFLEFYGSRVVDRRDGGAIDGFFESAGRR